MLFLFLFRERVLKRNTVLEWLFVMSPRAPKTLYCEVRDQQTQPGDSSTHQCCNLPALFVSPSKHVEGKTNIPREERKQRAKYAALWRSIELF